jgi:hypothetical protein
LTGKTGLLSLFVQMMPQERAQQQLSLPIPHNGAKPWRNIQVLDGVNIIMDHPQGCGPSPDDYFYNFK